MRESLVVCQMPILFEASCAGLTRASIFFEGMMDRRIKSGDDDLFREVACSHLSLVKMMVPDAANT
ncbi:MAG: hypothetical protein J0H25_18570, partial [Rhizobiales bacterium]|nr:hypothetical protein [Hyphomicrobiales bacterium]